MLAGGLVTVASRRLGRASLDLPAAARRAPEVAAVAVALRGEWAELAAAAEAVSPRRLPPLADLSAPPAVPSGVRAALGADFLGIDQLWRRVRGEAPWMASVQLVVEQAVGEYVGWLSGRGSVPTLVALRDRAEARRRARVERLLRRLPDLDERARELVEAMSRQLVTDVLHEPLSSLRSDASSEPQSKLGPCSPPAAKRAKLTPNSAALVGLSPSMFKVRLISNSRLFNFSPKFRGNSPSGVAATNS